MKTEYCHECAKQKPREGGGLKTICGSRCFVCQDCRPKLKTGRPKVDPETKKHAVAICLTNAQRKKLDMLGGSKHLQAYLDSVPCITP